MEKEIKCPNCGGNKYSMIDETSAKCLYCGTKFKIEENESHEEPKTQQDVHTNYEYVSGEEKHVHHEQNQKKHDRKRGVAGAYAIVLGGLGWHKFYLGHAWLGILYLIFCWSWIPTILGLIEGIIYLTMSDDEFDQKYNY
ncbi:TM2 domain-containing protein [Marseilla massiliensis]|uniref:TM2 domain-containing protein n=1 Tax=Marseilla massiliensis TaxID=1841864 RepID=UPI002010C848|nr:TM2 domain-containing protein [Marseilla massiliensis]MCL1610913.1 TM2 domain-containing protein [Marseilla massiliensis]